MFSSELIASFNELEMLLYNYVVKNGEKIIYMRIRDLADETHVSTSTILRFCRKANCAGFSEFKVKLKMELEKNEIAPAENSEHAFSDFMERSLKGGFESYIKEVAEVVASSKRIIFIGAGSSGILSEYGAHYFSGLGKFSTSIKDPYFPIYDDLHDTTTIALSISGETPQIIQLVDKLKKEGSRIVSITNNKNCTLSKISEINIAYYISEEHYKYTNITTQIPVLYILESIARQMHKLTSHKN